MIWKKRGSRTVLTLFGQIEVVRHIYQGSRGGDCWIPLDEEWGVREHYACPRVREICVYGSGLMTPGELVGLLSKSGPIRPSETAVRNMLGKYGTAMEAHADKAMETLLSEARPPEGTRVFVASMDGATLLMRNGNDAAKHPSETDEESSGAGHRVAMVGALGCYGVEEVVDESTGTSSLRPKRLTGDYFGRMPEEGCASFKSDFEFRCYEIAGKLPPDAVRILLMDGAKWQWSYVRGEAQFAGYEKLLDYWHACEHLGAAAEILFPRDLKARQRWRERWQKKLKTDDDAVPKLLGSMLRHLKIPGLGTKATESVWKEMAYFRNHADLMRYARFRRNGWPIGSGPVEAACKTLIKQRFCGSGMRWTPTGGQTILDIRSLIKSNRWDAFWEQVQKAA